jgi:anti-anti-sigma regulatory factor
MTIFKIDTKEFFALISPESIKIDANMADELLEFIKSNSQNDINNYIIDLSHVTTYDISSNDGLLVLHEYIYGELNGSIVFTGLNADLYNKFKQERLHLSLNITPTMIEAEDIINMELLERDILSEEE